MKENKLHSLLGKQFLVIALVEIKIQIVNYIMNGYNNNAPILMNNRFLHFTAHNYYRSVIVDLCALYCNNKTSHKYNFYRIISSPDFEAVLKPGTLSLVETWLANCQSDIEIIKALRDKQIAHYDFEKESIDFNFDNLKVINSLFDLAKRIINTVGGSFKNNDESVGYSFERKNHYLTSLERLIKDAVNHN